MVTAKNYRGKCESTHGKLTKGGQPTRAGNFSYSTFREQHLLCKDYYVRLHTYENGIQILIVGDHTPLAELMGELVATLAMRDEHFSQYTQRGTHTEPETGKEYEAIKTLTKNQLTRRFWQLDYHAFTYREMIYADGELDYEFPEY